VSNAEASGETRKRDEEGVKGKQGGYKWKRVQARQARRAMNANEAGTKGKRVQARWLQRTGKEKFKANN
jgi:hypothetical protein